MPHQGGPDGNIVNAIEQMERAIGEKVDRQTDMLRQLLASNVELLESIRDLLEASATE